MQAGHWSMIVFWNEVPQQPPNGDDVDYPGYEDPHGDMPVDDEDMPPPQSQQPEPDLHNEPIELGSGGDPPAPPANGAFVPVPENDSSDLEMDPGNNDGDHPPGGGPSGPGPGYGPSPDELPVHMEYHDEPPPPGGIESTYAVASTSNTNCSRMSLRRVRAVHIRTIFPKPKR
ncbi:unnamed protein product, partial [Symbiodinium necroappetens]